MEERAVHEAIWFAFAGLAAVVFLVLWKIPAPYGKHARAGWGPGLPTRWAWVLMESPACVGMALLFALGREAGPAEAVFFALWEAHYVHRTVIYPMLVRPASARTPLVVVLLGFAFNSVNAYLNGRWLFALSEPMPVEWLAHPVFLVGFALFLAGFLVNLHSDHVLRTLRGPGETLYKVPNRGLFRLVASANYFGECVEWVGWALLTWSKPGALFAVWTFANLAPRARSTLRWYRERFPDYPRERKALIPFVW